MKYQEFIENVKSHITTELNASQKLMVQPVIKNNGMVYDGLIIVDPILNISPTIYLNPYYHRYLNGVPMEDIYQDILTIYKKNLPEKDFDVSVFKDFSKARQRIVMKLVNRKRNEMLLRDVPFIPYYDLALVFLCSVTEFMDEYATILIHNQHLLLWNVTPEELYQIAMKNTPLLLSCRFNNMENVLEKMSGRSLPFTGDLNMYIVTNHLKIHGATCIAYPNLLNEISDVMKDNLIIIPSSIHEVLIIPEKAASSQYTLKDLDDTIKEVNETQLTDDEVLSDHAYLYNRATKTLEY